MCFIPNRDSNFPPDYSYRHIHDAIMSRDILGGVMTGYELDASAQYDCTCGEKLFLLTRLTDDRHKILLRICRTKTLLTDHTEVP
jgi:hypothetical protein